MTESAKTGDDNCNLKIEEWWQNYSYILDKQLYDAPTKTSHVEEIRDQQRKRNLLKWYYDENRIFPTEAILKNQQVVCMRRKMLLTIFKYLFSFQWYSSF